MAFEGLSEKLNATFKRLRGKGRLTENDVREAMREVRLALLEADVSFKVVKDFVASVTERAIGSDVLESLSPAQQVIKIVNEELMDELRRIKAAVEPTEILLVVDAMIGQDAVNAAKAFDDALDLTGVMLTKLDGDARGGAALSIRAVTGKPIKFVGQGEKLDQVDVFHPDRMASRILGMGDVLSLIEKAQENFDAQKAQELQEKLRKNRFTLTDLYDQLNQMKNMGSLSDIAGMLPGVDPKALEGANVDEKAMSRTEAIILSMTPNERDDPSILNNSRKKRIAAGAGVQIVDVNRLLKQFEAMKAMTKQLNSPQFRKMAKRARFGRRKGGFPFG